MVHVYYTSIFIFSFQILNYFRNLRIYLFNVFQPFGWLYIKCSRLVVWKAVRFIGPKLYGEKHRSLAWLPLTPRITGRTPSSGSCLHCHVYQQPTSPRRSKIFSLELLTKLPLSAPI